MADENMNQGGGAAAAQNKLESSKTHAKRAAADLKEATTAMAEDYRDKAAQAWDDAKVRVHTLREDGRRLCARKSHESGLRHTWHRFCVGLDLPALNSHDTRQREMAKIRPDTMVVS